MPTLYSCFWKSTASSAEALKVRCSFSDSRPRRQNDQSLRLWLVHVESVTVDAHWLFHVDTDLYLVAYALGSCRLTLGAAHAVSWRPLDSRLTRLEVRLGKHRRWLERETQNHVQQYADVSHYRKQYLDFLRNQERIRASDIPENEGQRTAKRWRRVEKARSWLCSSSALSQVDRRPEPYNPDSCAWFLQTSVYCKWRNRPFEKTVANDADFLVNSWQHRVLFIQGMLAVFLILDNRVLTRHSTSRFW